MDIQLERPDWKWMRASMSFPTVAGQAAYTLAQIEATGVNFANFGNWELETFRSYITASGIKSEFQMSHMPYNAWRDTYQFGSTRLTQTRPVQFTVTPDLGIGLGPTPADGYTISGDYFKAASEMSGNTDIPLLPTQFHMAIVYRAMMLFGVSEAASEIYDDGNVAFSKMLRRMAMQQLPTMQQADALA